VSYLIKESGAAEPNKRKFFVKASEAQFDEVRSFLKGLGWFLSKALSSFDSNYDWMCYVTFTQGRDENNLEGDCKNALARAGVVSGISGDGQNPGAAVPAGRPNNFEIDIDTWEEGLQRWLEEYFSQISQEQEEPVLDVCAVYQHLRLGEHFEAEDLIDKYVADGGDPREVARWRVQLYAAMDKWPEVDENLNLAPKLTENPIYSAWKAESAYRAREFKDVLGPAHFALDSLEKLTDRDDDEEYQFRRLQILLARSYNRLEQPERSIQFLTSYLRICWAEMDELDREDYLEELEKVAGGCLNNVGEQGPVLQVRRGLFDLIQSLPNEAGRIIHVLGLENMDDVDEERGGTEEVGSWEEVRRRWDSVHSERPYEAVAIIKDYINSGHAGDSLLCRARCLLAKTFWEDIRDSKSAAEILEELQIQGLKCVREIEGQDGLRILAKHRFSQGKIDDVLNISEEYLIHAWHSEVLALRGMALAEKGGREEEAITCLEEAESGGFVTTDTRRALGSLLIDQDPSRAKGYYLGIVREKWNDIDARQNLLLLEDDPREKASLCEELIAKLETLEDAVAQAELFDQRAEALLELGDQAATQAICDLIEICMEQDQFERALSLYHQAKDNLEEKYQLLEVLDSLGITEDGQRREQVASEYLDLAMQELGQPTPDSKLLRSIGERLFFISEDAFSMFKDEYYRLKKRLEENREFVSAQMEDLSDPLEGLTLSEDKLVIVGGYAAVRDRARSILENSYSLGTYAEVPPHWEQNLGLKQVKERIKGATIIVQVPRCLKHSNTYTLESARKSVGAPRQIQVMGKGFSSIIAAVITYCRQRAKAGEELENIG